MRRNNKGFTIVELMIASSVFAVVLILCTIAMLQIGRTYYKGITATRTQETAREIIDDVARAIQYGSGNPASLPSPGGDNQGYCAGGKRYSYALGWQVVEGTPDAGENQSRHGLVIDELSCETETAQSVAPSPPADPINGPGVGENPRELLNTRMRLAVFRICFPGASDPDCPDAPEADSDLYQITVRVVSGDNDLLEDRLDENGNPGTDGILDSCRAERAGGQFCAASELSTVVQKRVR